MNLASNGTPLDVLTEEDWETSYSLSKFDTIAAEKIHALTLSSFQDDECGNSTDWHWWAARFNGENADGSGPWGAGVILTEMPSGSVTAARYTSLVEYNARWADLENQWADAIHADCADGRECEGCASCENG